MLMLECPKEKIGRMHTSLVQNQPSGKTHIVLKYEQVWIVIDIVWSADLKM